VYCTANFAAGRNLNLPAAVDGYMIFIAYASTNGSVMRIRPTTGETIFSGHTQLVLDANGVTGRHSMSLIGRAGVGWSIIGEHIT